TTIFTSIVSTDTTIAGRSHVMRAEWLSDTIAIVRDENSGMWLHKRPYGFAVQFFIDPTWIHYPFSELTSGQKFEIYHIDSLPPPDAGVSRQISVDTITYEGEESIRVGSRDYICAKYLEIQVDTFYFTINGAPFAFPGGF